MRLLQRNNYTSLVHLLLLFLLHLFLHLLLRLPLSSQSTFSHRGDIVRLNTESRACMRMHAATAIRRAATDEKSRSFVVYRQGGQRRRATGTARGIWTRVLGDQQTPVLNGGEEYGARGWGRISSKRGESRRALANASSTMRAMYSSCHASIRCYYRYCTSTVPFSSGTRFGARGSPPPPPAGVHVHMWGCPFPSISEGELEGRVGVVWTRAFRSALSYYLRVSISAENFVNKIILTVCGNSCAVEKC